jgi:hypothetical protein
MTKSDLPRCDLVLHGKYRSGPTGSDLGENERDSGVKFKSNVSLIINIFEKWRHYRRRLNILKENVLAGKVVESDIAYRKPKKKKTFTKKQYDRERSQQRMQVLEDDKKVKRITKEIMKQNQRMDDQAAAAMVSKEVGFTVGPKQIIVARSQVVLPGIDWKFTSNDARVHRMYVENFLIYRNYGGKFVHTAVKVFCGYTNKHKLKNSHVLDFIKDHQEQTSISNERRKKLVKLFVDFFDFMDTPCDI